MKVSKNTILIILFLTPIVLIAYIAFLGYYIENESRNPNTQIILPGSTSPLTKADPVETYDARKDDFYKQFLKSDKEFLSVSTIRYDSTYSSLLRFYFMHVNNKDFQTALDLEDRGRSVEELKSLYDEFDWISLRFANATDIYDYTGNIQLYKGEDIRFFTTYYKLGYVRGAIRIKSATTKEVDNNVFLDCRNEYPMNMYNGPDSPINCYVRSNIDGTLIGIEYTPLQLGKKIDDENVYVTKTFIGLLNYIKDERAVYRYNIKESKLYLVAHARSYIPFEMMNKQIIEIEKKCGSSSNNDDYLKKDSCFYQNFGDQEWIKENEKYNSIDWSKYTLNN